MSKYKIVIYFFFFMVLFLSKTMSENSKNLFNFSIDSISGDKLNLSKFEGKTILLVNVASKCGFTNQYTDLQNLYDLYKDRGFVIVGIPSNQFGGQEPATEDEIKNFCETNFNINFPMTAKYDVKGKNAHPIYIWAEKSFGRSAVPKWNFHKILVNKEGKIEDTFASFTNPMSKKLIKKIEENL